MVFNYSWFLRFYILASRIACSSITILKISVIFSCVLKAEEAPPPPPPRDPKVPLTFDEMWFNADDEIEVRPSVIFMDRVN